MSEESLNILQNKIEFFSFIPIMESIVEKKYAEYGEAVSVNPDYANLFRKAVRFMASAWKYFEPECQNPKAFLDRFRKSTKYYVSMESLEEIYDSIGDSVSDWDMLKSLLDFK